MVIRCPTPAILWLRCYNHTDGGCPLYKTSGTLWVWCRLTLYTLRNAMTWTSYIFKGLNKNKYMSIWELPYNPIKLLNKNEFLCRLEMFGIIFPFVYTQGINAETSFHCKRRFAITNDHSAGKEDNRKYQPDTFLWRIVNLTAWSCQTLLPYYMIPL